MLNKLKIQGFQSHIDTDIEFSPIITAFIGNSNQGKTAVFRAINWVRTNRPSGDAFVNNDTNSCSVKLDSVTHTKRAKEHSYKVGEKEFKAALKQSVPQEVNEALNLSDDNVQSQHDSIFLLNTSPGRVAEKLSTLVDLTIAHRAIQSINTRKKNTTAQITASTLVINECDEIIEELAALEDAVQAHADLGAKQARIATLKQNHATIHAAVKNVQEARSRLSAMPSIDSLDLAYLLRSRYAKLAKDKQDYAAVLTLVRQIEKLRRRCVAPPDELIEELMLLKTEKRFAKDFERVVGAVLGATVAVADLAKKKNVLGIELKDVMGGVCPLCKQEIK